MPEPRLLAFLALMVLVAAVIPWAARHARRRGSDQVERALQDLESRGFAVEEGATPRGRTAVRVWGVLEHPVGLDLRVARRSRWSRFSRVAGSGSAGMLDPIFEQVFRIHSREPERARVVLDPEIQRLLLALPKAELRLGSFESLLPRSYADRACAREDRRLRRLWMIQVPGKRAKIGDPAPVGELGRRVADAVAKHALAPSTPDLSAYQTVAAEAWI